MLDKDGRVVVKYVYDAWGNHEVKVLDSNCTELSQLNPFRYRGYYYDPETKLYYLKSRYYDPEIGRFITIDDLSYLDPEHINGLNLYAYCGNNPVMAVDPEGTKPKWWQWLINAVVLVVGAVLCFVPGGQALGVPLLIAGGSMLLSNVLSAAGVNGKVASIITSVVDIVAGIALCFTPFASLGASMIGSGIGGLAGGFISEAFGGSFELGAGIGSIIGGLIGGLVYKGATTTKIYRATSSVEAENIMKTGKFSVAPGQMEGKFFATSKADAIKWKNLLGESNVVAVRVVKSALTHNSITYFKMLDGIGAAYYFSDINFLNSIIKYLKILI